MVNKIPENTLGINAKMLRVMIAAPGDLKDEVRVVIDAINNWNLSNSEAEGIFLLSKHWQTNSHPRLGKSGQEIINDQMVDHADILIAMFWNRLGTPTKKAPSGTVEEISHFYEAGKTVKVYFSNAPVRRSMMISELDRHEIDRLETFKESIQKLGLYSEYDDLAAFRTQIESHIYDEVRSLKREKFVYKRRSSRIKKYLSINDFVGINETNWEEKAVGITIFIIQKTISDSDERINLTMASVTKLFQLVLWHIGIKFYRVNLSSAVAKLISECLSLGLIDAKNKKLSMGSRTAYLYSSLSKASITKVFNGVSSRYGDIYYGFSINDSSADQHAKAVRDIARVGVDMSIFNQLTDQVEGKIELRIPVPADILMKIESINKVEFLRQTSGKGRLATE
jgi:hypothetical protein